MTNHSVIDTPSTYIFSKDKFIGKYHEGSFNPKILEKWIFETLDYNYLRVQKERSQLKLDKQEERRKLLEKHNALKEEEMYQQEKKRYQKEQAEYENKQKQDWKKELRQYKEEFK